MKVTIEILKTTYKIVPFLAFLSIIHSSCKKDTGCKTPEKTNIYVDKDVHLSWPLKLHYDNENYVSYDIEVTFPNGEVKKFEDDDYINNSYLILTDSATAEHSGSYLLKLKNKGCDEWYGSDETQILPTPEPPCQIQNNTGTSTIGSVGGGSYYGVTSAGSSENDFHVVGYTYLLWHMNFRFNSENPPKPGLYKSISSYSAIGEDKNKVGVYFVHSYDEFLIKADQDVYVNYVDGKLVITLCLAEFNNHLTSSDLLISVKLVVD